MKTNAKIILGVFAGFVIGCAVGMIISSETTEGAGAGDIVKVAKFNRNVVSPTMSAFQEKVMNDPEELQKTTASLAILTSRMAEFNELVSIAALVSEGNEELASSLENLQKVKSLAENARTNGVEALDALNSIADGKKPATDYEQATQNLALTYMLVDRQICIGKQYVCDVDAFLRGKNVEDYKELALARDLWAGYCAGEAVLNGDSEELEYWNKQESLISSDALALKAADFTMAKYPVESLEVLRQCISLDEAAGIGGGYKALKANGALNESIAEGAVPQALKSFAGAHEALFQTEVFRTQRELGYRNSEVQQFIAPEAFNEVLGAVSVFGPGLNGDKDIPVITLSRLLLSGN